MQGIPADTHAQPTRRVYSMLIIDKSRFRVFYHFRFVQHPSAAGKLVLLEQGGQAAIGLNMYGLLFYSPLS
ncbi:hypothetical protein HL42_6327 [Trichophyton rubrum]|nr:hypothetical protein HL42_6327 [Trichophyton rubrum]